MSGLNITDLGNALDDTQLDDQSVAVTTGGFERKRLPIGRHPIRLVSYIELGVQEGGMYDGAKKPDEAQARMIFQFLSKRTIEEVPGKDGAEPTLFAPKKSLTKKLSYHQKAGFYKLFQTMRAGDSSIKHMAELVGTRAWLVNVVWRTKNDAGEYIDIKKSEIPLYEERLKNAKTEAEKKDYRIFDNIKWDTLGAPVVPILDDDGEDTGDVKPVKVPEHIGDLQLFLWDTPKPVFWDSIHIAGTYTKKVGDKEETVSKNFIQEAIMGAKNYEGSPIQAMLEGLDDLPTTKQDTPGEGEGEKGPKKPAKTQTADAEETSKEDASSHSDDDGSSELDEMGLII